MPPTPTTPSTSLTPPSSSSGESSSSATPRVSSPLNPANTPNKAPLPLPELEDDLEGFPDSPGRVRGIVASSPRNKPLSGSGPLLRVTSSPASTAIPLPDHQEGRLFSFMHRTRSRSPSGRIDDNVWRKKVNETETPPSGQGVDASPSASWWGEGGSKSWQDFPRRRRHMSPEEKEAWLHTREVSFLVALLVVVGLGVVDG